MASAKAKCVSKTGKTLFEVEAAGMAINVIHGLTDKIASEFDHCFEADDWSKIVIEISRDTTTGG